MYIVYYQMLSRNYYRARAELAPPVIFQQERFHIDAAAESPVTYRHWRSRQMSYSDSKTDFRWVCLYQPCVRKKDQN